MASDPPAAHACVRCGATLDDDAPEGSICAACAGSEAEEHTPTAILGETPSQPLTGSVRTAAPAQPERIGDFEVLGKLGQGGMGAVYRARQVTLDRMVALKILPTQFEDDDTYVSRFQREASVAARLNHPNLVRVYTSGHADGCHFIAMELVEGENLRQRLRRTGPFPPLDALRICLGVARGLQCGWQTAQLIHRDIKPSNIYLAMDGAVKLGDLGLAKSLLTNTTGVTHTGTAIGTPHYISPEQARGEKTLDFRADIYSLGCTLYELLTGATPYQGSDPMTIMGMHIHTPPPAILKVLPQCPIPLGRLVNKMLRKSKHERPQSYEELIAAMEAAIDQLENPAGPSAVVQAWKEIGKAEQGFLPARGSALSTPHPPEPAGTRSSAPGSTPLPDPAPRKLPLLWLGIGAGAFVLGLLAVYLMRPAPPSPLAQSQQNPTPRIISAPRTTPSQSPAPASAPPPGSANGAAPTESWRDVLHDPAALALSGKAERAEEGLRLTGQANVWDRGGTNHPRDVAVRARLTLGDIPVKVLIRSEQANNYFLNVQPGQGLELRRRIPGSPQSTLLRAFDTPPALSAGKTYTVEVRAIGANLTVTLDGQELGTAQDDQNRTGNCQLRSDDYPNGSPTLVTAFEVLDLERASATVSVPVAIVTPAAASKDAPFVNSLGMKFVPVPITGGPTGGQRVLFSIWVTRVQDYEVFATETKRKWPKAEFEQGPTHPAVQVSWEDATAFCAWLTERERGMGRLAANESYRLPSDHEWSCAAGLGEREDSAKSPIEKDGRLDDGFAWGTQWPPPAKAGNYASEELTPFATARKPGYPPEGAIPGYYDGYAATAPVGSFAANRFGLFDISGNVRQHCEDWFKKHQNERVTRGSSWRISNRNDVVPSHRTPTTAANTNSSLGFRVVLGPVPEGK